MHRIAPIIMLHLLHVVLCITSSPFAIAFTISNTNIFRHCNDDRIDITTYTSCSSTFKVGMTSTIIDYENEITEETNPM